MTDVIVQVAPDGVQLDATYVTNGNGAVVARLNANVSGGSLPAGAATAANQTSVIGGGASGGTAATNSELVGGVYNSTAPTVTNGQQVALQTDVNGRLLTTAASGSTGANYSANRPTLPNVGANFAASGPYASYVLIATVAANPARFNIDVENNSGAQIVVVRDDGTAAGGAAPVNASVFALAGGSGVGSQGGAWSSQTFRGRLQIYAAASTAQVAVMGD